MWLFVPGPATKAHADTGAANLMVTSRVLPGSRCNHLEDDGSFWDDKPFALKDGGKGTCRVFVLKILVTFEQDKSSGPGPKASQFDVRPAEKKLLPNGAMTMGSLAFVAGAVDAVCCTKYRCFLEHLGFDLLWPHSSLILWHKWGYTNMMTGNSASWLWWMYFVCLFVCIQECFLSAL